MMVLDAKTHQKMCHCISFSGVCVCSIKLNQVTSSFALPMFFCLVPDNTLHMVISEHHKNDKKNDFCKG